MNILTVLTLNFVAACMTDCKSENHIEKYEVSPDSLTTLSDGFYAFRRGRVYYEYRRLKEYRVWVNLDNFGNVSDIFKIEDFSDKSLTVSGIINKYGIDTAEKKKLIQKFIDLSRKYKFGHISVDGVSKISFSYLDGLPEQYVMTLNDSLRNVYLRNKDFRLLKNNWFEFIKK